MRLHDTRHREAASRRGLRGDQPDAHDVRRRGGQRSDRRLQLSTVDADVNVMASARAAASMTAGDGDAADRTMRDDDVDGPTEPAQSVGQHGSRRVGLGQQQRPWAGGEHGQQTFGDEALGHQCYREPRRRNVSAVPGPMAARPLAIARVQGVGEPFGPVGTRDDYPFVVRHTVDRGAQGVAAVLRVDHHDRRYLHDVGADDAQRLPSAPTARPLGDDDRSGRPAAGARSSEEVVAEARASTAW